MSVPQSSLGTEALPDMCFAVAPGVSKNPSPPFPSSPAKNFSHRTRTLQLLLSRPKPAGGGQGVTIHVTPSPAVPHFGSSGDRCLSEGLLSYRPLGTSGQAASSYGPCYLMAFLCRQTSISVLGLVTASSPPQDLQLQ